MNDEPYQAVSEWNPCFHEPIDMLQRVRERTVALAVASGRSELDISRFDYEFAKCEITGESEPQRQMAVLYPGLFSSNP